jgi:uncharacterized repeat protein (TIGR03843 family)
VPKDQRPPTARHLSLLAEGDVEVVGRMPWSSNHTFLTTCASGDDEIAAVYKPGRGERQLWDFPDRIYRREVAAFELSRALGWDVVPETVERADAPLGPGSLQRFVDADFSQHHFTLVEDEANHPRLKAICAFDVVANNADRKSGHCIVDDDGTIWAIDNGLSFHPDEEKLRTVIWEFAGERIPAALTEDLCRVGASPPEALRALLSAKEVHALTRRIDRLVAAGRFPHPDPDRYHYPWPLI